MARKVVAMETKLAVVLSSGADINVTAVCAQLGISRQTFYRWKGKYGGLAVSDAQKLKALEDENRRLKQLLAESMPGVAALKDLLGKN